MLLKFKVSKSDNLQGIRCLVVTEKIKKNEIIERCPIIFLTMKDLEHIEKTPLDSYEFCWNNKYDVIVLGYGSLINHAAIPNVHFRTNFKTKTMDFIALRDIEPDEELFVNYWQGVDESTLPAQYTDFKY